MEKYQGKKIGMTQVFNAQGALVPVTVLQFEGELPLKEGDLVKVRGRSIGKGFAGNVKRFHTHRGPMSHGSKSHRIPGSSGSGTTPGRVFRGRKMPGRLGGGFVTVGKLPIVQIVAEKKLLLIRGALPGKRGNKLIISKA